MIDFPACSCQLNAPPELHGLVDTTPLSGDGRPARRQHERTRTHTLPRWPTFARTLHLRVLATTLHAHARCPTCPRTPRAMAP